jgi:hypothetical protein
LLAYQTTTVIHLTLIGIVISNDFVVSEKPTLPATSFHQPFLLGVEANHTKAGVLVARYG